MTIFDSIRFPVTHDTFQDMFNVIPVEILDYWRSTPSRTTSENMQELQELIYHYNTESCCVHAEFTRYDAEGINIKLKLEQEKANAEHIQCN